MFPQAGRASGRHGLTAYNRFGFPYTNKASPQQARKDVEPMGRNQSNNNGKKKQPGNRGDSDTAQAGTSKEK
jgi:hypothetical protein